MLKEQKRLNKAKGQNANEKESLSYSLLMAIPRNLVYVFLLVIIIAFAGMIYVVYSEKDLSSFMYSSNVEVQENIMVHPLF